MDSNPSKSNHSCSIDRSDRKMIYTIVALFVIILILTVFMANKIKKLDEMF